jgi:hypothetical protein
VYRLCLSSTLVICCELVAPVHTDDYLLSIYPAFDLARVAATERRAASEVYFKWSLSISSVGQSRS